MDEVFVLLSTYDQKPDSERLNLQEMWCSLVLQSFPSPALRTYLPDPQNLAPWAGNQLNISSPMHQVLSKNTEGEIPKEIGLDFQNRLFLTYLKGCIESFQDLRNSDDPFFQEYYRRTVMNSSLKGRLAFWGNLSRQLQDGRDVEIHISKKTRGRLQFFQLGGLSIKVSPRFVTLEDHSRVVVKVSIEESKPHPHHYTLCSQDTDPASRLAIHVSGTDVEGEKFAGWIHCSGEKNVLRVNTLVDRLEGNPKEYSKLQPRRIVRQWSGWYFTSQ
jgi:hypothetical protein